MRKQACLAAVTDLRTVVVTRRRLYAGPFIKLGPLRNVPGYAEVAGCLSAAGLVAILTAALGLYGATSFQQVQCAGSSFEDTFAADMQPVLQTQGRL